MISVLRAAAAILSALLLAVVMHAQPGTPRILKVSPSVPKSVQAGKTFTVEMAVTVDAPYHIQGNPAKEGYIATEMEVGAVKGFKVERVVYPKPTKTSFSGETLPIYSGRLRIRADVMADRDIRPGRYTLPITLKFQGCDDQKCFPPTTITARAQVAVRKGAR